MPRISTRLSALRSTPFTTHRAPTLPLLRSNTAFPTPLTRSTSVSRALHTTRPSYAKYERFDQRPSFGGSPGPSGGGPTLWEYVKRRMGGDRAVWVYGIGIGGGGIYYVTHLERVPETGRLRFMDVDEAQERELGRQTQLQTLSEYDRAVLPPNHPISKRVRKVATRIIESSGLGRVKSSGEMGAIEGKDTEWEVYVIDDKKTKNAFVLPGGKIFVFTGILPVSANDDGLATVLGHEIAHQVARHPAERMSSMKVLFALGFLLETLGLDVGVSRLLLTFMLQLPNSRKNESEADFIGLRLMSRACFDPTESSKMWQRMSASEGGKGLSVDFLSTHPANAKRIKQLENWMPEAQQIRAASPCGITSDNFNGFLDAVNPHGGSYGSRLW